MDNPSVPRRPLDGVTVLDFSRVLAGPYATALLADLGARIIKVEPPTGDDYRHVGPFVNGESALFAFTNRGKESIALDLKRPEDRSLAQKLADRADVVVENFRPGVADKLGIGPEALMARNPRLIYASISGFGQTGPMRERPAYDIIVQAVTGLMSITGKPEDAPTMVGEAFGDLTAGLYASWSVLAALYQREQTGTGCRIDLAMFDALLSMMPTATCRYIATGETPQRVGNRHPLSAPFGVFKTGDGHVAIAVLNEKLFERFCGAIERRDLLQDARFATDGDRASNEGALRQAFEAWSCTRATEDVVAMLSRAGVPSSPIETVAHAIESEHSTVRQLFRPSNLGGRAIRLPEQPVAFSTMERGQRVDAPRLNEHEAAVRAWTEGGNARR